MRPILALVALLAAFDAPAFLINVPFPVTVVEFHNAITRHYFMAGEGSPDMSSIDAGGAGPGWRRTGYAFVGYLSPPCTGCVPVERFYGTPGLGPNSHFYTANVDEAAGLRRPGTGWSYEKTAFWIAVPDASGQCALSTVPVYRLYNNLWMFNDSNHRYVTSPRVRGAMRATGWIDEGAKFCSTATVEVPIKAFKVEIPLEHRILPSAQCEDESQGLGACLAVNNVAAPSQRMGPYDINLTGVFGNVTGVHSTQVYAPGGGYGATPEAIAQGVFVNGVGVNGVAIWVGIHVDTRDRAPWTYASINPLYQFRTTPHPGGADERFFPFADDDSSPPTELSIYFGLNVRKVAVHDGTSYAYGHPTIEFIDSTSGQHLYFTVLAYGIDNGGDYLAPDVATGKVIVGTSFRESTPYGRSMRSKTLHTPPGFEGLQSGSFDFRMDRDEFQRVIDSARSINPALSSDPADYLVDNFHFNNEVVGNAEIGMGVGQFALRVLPAL